MGKLKESWKKVSEDWSAEVHNELNEHPWLTYDQAEKVVRDHRAGKKMLQQRDLTYPIMAYKGTKLPTTDTSITGISKEIAGDWGKTEEKHAWLTMYGNLTNTGIRNAKTAILTRSTHCKNCKTHYVAGTKVLGMSNSRHFCPKCGARLP